MNLTCAVYCFLGSGSALADFLTLFRARGLAATGEYVVIVPQDESRDPEPMDRDSFSFGIRTHTHEPPKPALPLDSAADADEPFPDPSASRRTLPLAETDELANASSSTARPTRRASRNVQEDPHGNVSQPPSVAEEVAVETSGDEYRNVLFVAQHTVDTDKRKQFHEAVLQKTFELWSPNKTNHMVEQPTVRHCAALLYCSLTTLLVRVRLLCPVRVCSCRYTRRICTTRCKCTCKRSTKCSPPAATRSTARTSSRGCLTARSSVRLLLFFSSVLFSFLSSFLLFSSVCFLLFIRLCFDHVLRLVYAAYAFLYDTMRYDTI